MYTRKTMTTGWGIAQGLVRNALAVAVVGSAGVAFASVALPATAMPSNGFVTTWATDMESIFSGQSFIDAALNLSQDPFSGIDIHFNATETVAATSLLSIDSDAEFGGAGLSLNTLSNQLGVPNFTVSMFFVDSITYCGGSGTNIIGCGRNSGGLLALKSSAAAGANGAELLAHELGHNLGLNHLVDSSNLMNASITGKSFLSVAQATTILSSRLVQGNGGARTIFITPIAVIAAVPEPETWAMMMVGLLGVAGWARRRQANAG